MRVSLILSGGTGSRLGRKIPKQYLEVDGRLVISYCLKTLFHHHSIDMVQIVASHAWRDTIQEEIKKLGVGSEKFRGFSEPGETRQLSIYNGLGDILNYAGSDDYVMIHDAARPMLSNRQIEGCFLAVDGHDGVMPSLPMKDTVYMSSDGEIITGLLDRSKIFAGQAPEVFRLGTYYEANQNLLPEKILKINGSAEPAVLYGMDVVMIPGDETNFKITTMEDLERFREIAVNWKISGLE